MPLYEYFCEECQREFTLLQSASVDREETACSECGSQNTSPQLSSFSSKVQGGKPRTPKAAPATEDDFPNKDVFKLPIPRLRSEL